jgi:hypothetical protein
MIIRRRMWRRRMWRMWRVWFMISDELLELMATTDTESEDSIFAGLNINCNLGESDNLV